MLIYFLDGMPLEFAKGVGVSRMCVVLDVILMEHRAFDEINAHFTRRVNAMTRRVNAMTRRVKLIRYECLMKFPKN